MSFATFYNQYRRHRHRHRHHQHIHHLHCHIRHHHLFLWHHYDWKQNLQEHNRQTGSSDAPGHGGRPVKRVSQDRHQRVRGGVDRVLKPEQSGKLKWWLTMPNEFSSLQHYFYSIFKDLPQFIMKTLPEAKRIRHTSPNSIWTQFLSNPGLIIVYACHWLTDRKSLILLSTLASLPQKSPKTCDFFKLLHFWRIFMNSHQITGRRRRSSGRAEKGGSPATLNLTLKNLSHHYSHDNLGKTSTGKKRFLSGIALIT